MLIYLGAPTLWGPVVGLRYIIRWGNLLSINSKLQGLLSTVNQESFMFRILKYEIHLSSKFYACSYLENCLGAESFACYLVIIHFSHQLPSLIYIVQFSFDYFFSTLIFIILTVYHLKNISKSKLGLICWQHATKIHKQN